MNEPETQATRLASLHPEFGIDTVDIRSLVDDVRHNGPQCLPNNLAPKTRRNILSAIFIERMWRLVEKAEERSRETFGLRSDAMKTFVAAHAKSDDLALVFSGLQRESFEHLQLMATREAQRPDAVTDELKATVYQDDQGTEQIMYPNRIELGISNALQMSWQSMRIIPYMVEDTTCLTPERYKQLCLRNISLLRNLAKSHLTVFSAVHVNTSWKEFPGFGPTNMRFIGSGDAKRMDYQSFVMDSVEMHRDRIKGSIATFCPALFAKASDGKDVIRAMYKWCMRIGDTVLFPHIQAILGRTHMKTELQMMCDDTQQITAPNPEEVAQLCEQLKKKSVSSS